MFIGHSFSPTQLPADLISQVTHIASIASRPLSEAALEAKPNFSRGSPSNLSLIGSYPLARCPLNRNSWSEALFE